MQINTSKLPLSWLACCAVFCSASLQAQPATSTDLAAIAPTDGLYLRLLGSVGTGSSGVPVAGGFDLDKDGLPDYAMASMRASPQGRFRAGQVFLVFGDGLSKGLIDTAVQDPRVLEIHGDQVQESAGSEIWMGDVTGDGYGDLIICRQNYSADGDRIGSGALTLIPANPMLRSMAEANEVLDLRSPPAQLAIVNLYGAMQYSRLCMWARTGDVTGDGIDEIVIGADRESSNGDANSGAVYVLRGGAYLEASQEIDLIDFGTVALGNIARVRPRPGSVGFDLGATVQAADLDGNGRAEVIAAAALQRSGGSLAPLGGTGRGVGGTENGTVFIAWDDNFGGNWIPAPDFVIDEGSGSYTIIDGGESNDSFGEEILGGLDYDNDGKADLFIGDLTSDGLGDVVRINTGLAQVIYDAASLKNLEFDLEPDEEGENGPPAGFAMATFIGPRAGGITGDTALQGDFNGDGIADVAFSSPDDAPLGRIGAGTLHIAFGKTGTWPAVSDLLHANYPEPSAVRLHEVYGAMEGDMLAYSAAAGDMTGDGVPDLIINEMLGDGSLTADVGNLLIIDSRLLIEGQTIFRDGFED